MTRPLPAIILGTLLLAATAAPAGDRDAAARLVETWQQTSQLPGEARAAWESFTEEHLEDELGALGRLMQGIALMREGASAETIAPLLDFPPPAEKDDDAPPSPPTLADQLHAAGRGLEARLRMRELASSLQQYYRTHVEYPDSLAALLGSGQVSRADLRDPYGRPFDYSATARNLMPDIPRQTFSLRCGSINASHKELSQALRPGAAPAGELTISSLDPTRGQAFVKRTRSDGTLGPATLWTLGQTQGDLVLWAVYDQFIIVGWRQFPQLFTR